MLQTGEEEEHARVRMAWMPRGEKILLAGGPGQLALEERPPIELPRGVKTPLAGGQFELDNPDWM